jgi:hypothetical protein
VPIEHSLLAAICRFGKGRMLLRLSSLVVGIDGHGFFLLPWGLTVGSNNGAFVGLYFGGTVAMVHWGEIMLRGRYSHFPHKFLGSSFFSGNW